MIRIILIIQLTHAAGVTKPYQNCHRIIIIDNPITVRNFEAKAFAICHELWNCRHLWFIVPIWNMHLRTTWIPAPVSCQVQCLAGSHRHPHTGTHPVADQEGPHLLAVDRWSRSLTFCGGKNMHLSNAFS